MKHKLTALALALVLALGITGCGQKAPQLYSSSWFDLFDTVTVVQGYATSQQEWDRQMDALHKDLLEYHQLYDIYNTYEGIENLCSINAKAGQGPVQADPRILELLQLALELYQKTDGKLNVAMGSVLGLWHDAREQAQLGAAKPELPAQEALEAAAQHQDPAGVVLDLDAGTIALTDPKLQLDVGSIGKGYAVEMATQAAEKRGLTSALLNVGGNLRAIGTKPNGAQWAAGIQDPDDEHSYRYAVRLQDMALVTSGDYQRFFEVDGVRVHHLIDPDTLMPAAYARSVTVLAPDSGLADGLSTALFCTDPQTGLALVEQLEDVEALWILPDGQNLESIGFSSHLRQ